MFSRRCVYTLAYKPTESHVGMEVGVWGGRFSNIGIMPLQFVVEHRHFLHAAFFVFQQIYHHAFGVVRVRLVRTLPMQRTPATLFCHFLNVLTCFDLPPYQS